MGLFRKFVEKVLGQNEARDADWQELTEELLKSDLGRELTESIVNSAKKSKLPPIEALTEVLSDSL